ncbi:MAG: hypothetical protein J5786_02550 [Clostridiales bacterium]|nr:hypothetical protein [Clostridiales bacterium]
MDISDYKAYFETECRVISPDVTYLHIYAKKLFAPVKINAIKEYACKIPGYKNLCQTGGGFSVSPVLQRCLHLQQGERDH